MTGLPTHEPSRARRASARRAATPLAAALLVAVVPGCASPLRTGWFGPELPAADARNPVSRIVCIWEPSEGQGVDGLPTRGFAGQILFFTRGTAVPVTVDGDVRVYLFDDRGTPQEQAKPIHQFDFLGDAWSIHLQKTNLGAAYSVFVPYVRKDPWQAHCTMRVRFTPRDGAPVYSETARVTLPGPIPQSDSPGSNAANAPTGTHAAKAAQPEPQATPAHASIANRHGTAVDLARPGAPQETNSAPPARTDEIDPRRAKQQDLERLLRDLLATSKPHGAAPPRTLPETDASPLARRDAESTANSEPPAVARDSDPAAPIGRRHRLAPAAFDSTNAADGSASTPHSAPPHPLAAGRENRSSAPHPLADPVP
jgi:hypothetical protein